jgi:hypothetical protein
LFVVPTAEALGAPTGSQQGNRNPMKLFECQNCDQPLYFENTRCESCGLSLGYLPSLNTMTALKADPPAWHALASPGRYRYCANAAHQGCNWLIAADDSAEYCQACRHNRTIPDLGQDDNLLRWRQIEVAKRRLFYTLICLRLPLRTRAEDPNGLAFDFLVDAATSSGATPVLTGHDNGVITINVAEADDVERERRRSQLGEPYRTLLGHFRHEIAHYYWDRLVANSSHLEEFRQVFGDERKDYAAALRSYYAAGAPADWPEHFVTAYATAHPWEDFAETWAHYFHMVDTLETAGAFGLVVAPKLTKGLPTTIDFDPHIVDTDRLIKAWIPLTFAANSINRSMGAHDLYPFVLSLPVIAKLAFIRSVVHTQRGGVATPDGGIRAMIASLRHRVGMVQT